jgi:hypothetical protein
MKDTFCRLVSLLVLLTALPSCAPCLARAQSAEDIVHKVVQNELQADANDHTTWMYRDAYQAPDKNVVRIVIETSQGSLSEVIEDSGHNPSAQEHQNDLNHNQQLVSDASARQKQKRNNQHDDQQAREMLNLLPNAFTWKIVSQANNTATLSFQPNPSFSPSSMSGKVLAAMSGTMTVDTQQMRMKNLAGRLDKDVDFAWGLLGRINAGGTFQLVRQEVGAGSWQNIEMHVHISGHALFFKTIGDQEDEVTSDYHRVPDGTDLNTAAQMLSDGDAARELGIDVHFGM